MKNNAITLLPENELIDDSPAIVFLVDMNTENIRWCNKTMVETLGYSLDEMQQLGPKLLEIILHPEDYSKALKTKELLITGRERHNLTCRFKKRSTGEWNWFYGIAVVHEYNKEGNAGTLFCSFLELNSSHHSIQSGQIMPPTPDNASGINSLSHREQELLPYLAKGLSNKEIAELTFNSPHTIKTHVESILQILEIHSKLKLVVFLKNLGY